MSDKGYRKQRPSKRRIAAQRRSSMSKIGNYVIGLQEAMVDCPECDGEGRCEYERAVPMSNSNPYGYIEDYWAECDNCQGTGQIENDLED